MPYIHTSAGIVFMTSLMCIITIPVMVMLL